MTDREVLAYIRGMVEMTSMDIDAQNTILRVIDNQLVQQTAIITDNNIVLTRDESYGPSYGG